MADPSRHPMALAYEWVGRILAAVSMMVGPAWLADRYLGSGPWTLSALAVGVVIGTVYLVVAAQAFQNTGVDRKPDDDD